MKRLALACLMSATLAAGALTGCATTASTSVSTSASTPSAASSESAAGTSATASVSTALGSSVLDTAELFTDRDLEQEADISDATSIALESGQDVTVSEEGVYVLSGTATDVTVTVSADSSAKVQLVLDGVSIVNDAEPAIYIESADKVFVTTAQGSTNKLAVTGVFATTTDNNVDGVIFAKDDLVLNGQGVLAIDSSDNGIVGKDDVKVTGGTYNITAVGNGIEGKDSVAIANGTFNLDAQNDGIHAENSDDATLGFVYIAEGTFNIQAGSDGIEGAAVVQVDGGNIAIDAAEGIEATYVQINGGMVDIVASDDGINATSKSTAYSVTLEITGGNVSVNMGAGDTDALDANGNLYISGGTVDIVAQSAFDYDGEGVLSGGTVTVNGEQVTELTSSMMGGPGGPGGQGGQGGPGRQVGQGGMR